MGPCRAPPDGLRAAGPRRRPLRRNENEPNGSNGARRCGAIRVERGGLSAFAGLASFRRCKVRAGGPPSPIRATQRRLPVAPPPDPRPPRPDRRVGGGGAGSWGWGAVKEKAPGEVGGVDPLGRWVEEDGVAPRKNSACGARRGVSSRRCRAARVGEVMVLSGGPVGGESSSPTGWFLVADDLELRAGL